MKPENRHGHIAHQIDHEIIMFGGEIDSQFLDRTSFHTIWIFNLYVQLWKKHVIPPMETVPKTLYSSRAAVINKDIYVFGGLVVKPYDETSNRIFIRNSRNSLWKLTRTPIESFVWNQIPGQSETKTPSPRYCHDAWRYCEKLWVFGGCGHMVPEINLIEHGDFNAYVYQNISFFSNNQLLCFDPSGNEWTNPNCQGTPPSPRMLHTCAAHGDKVWLYGGVANPNFINSSRLDDLYQLDMLSLTWTKIEEHLIKSQRLGCTLTAVTDGQLVLHGGGRSLRNPCCCTWIVDVTAYTKVTPLSTSVSCSLYRSDKDHPRSHHTGCLGMNAEIVIIGGLYKDLKTDMEDMSYNMTFHVMLEPRMLQQLAMATVYKHRNELPWSERLPKKLTDLFIIPVAAESTEYVSDESISKTEKQ